MKTPERGKIYETKGNEAQFAQKQKPTSKFKSASSNMAMCEISLKTKHFYFSCTVTERSILQNDSCHW